MAVAGRTIPRNAVVVGTGKIQGERLDIEITSLDALLMGCARKETIWRVTCLTGVAVFFFPFCTVEGSRRNATGGSTRLSALQRYRTGTPYRRVCMGRRA